MSGWINVTSKFSAENNLISTNIRFNQIKNEFKIQVGYINEIVTMLTYQVWLRFFTSKQNILIRTEPKGMPYLS